MPYETNKFLYDIKEACSLIASVVENVTFEQFEADPLLRSAIERQIEIIVKAIVRLEKVEPALAKAIPNYRRMMAFRNILIHGYAVLESATLWGVIETDIPRLKPYIEQMMNA